MGKTERNSVQEDFNGSWKSIYLILCGNSFNLILWKISVSWIDKYNEKNGLYLWNLSVSFFSFALFSYFLSCGHLPKLCRKGNCIHFGVMSNLWECQTRGINLTITNNPALSILKSYTQRIHGTESFWIEEIHQTEYHDQSNK